MSLGAGFLLWFPQTELLHSCVTTFLAGVQQKENYDEDCILPQKEQHGSMLQEFVVLKFSCMPEIKTLGHRPEEHRVQMEIVEARIIDIFSVRAH